MGLSPLTITPTGGKAATVTFTDFVACDAIEHVLDTVLVPESVSSRPSLQSASCLPVASHALAMMKISRSA